MATTQLWQVGLTMQHLQAIGLIAVRWSYLEHTLSAIIWKLANLRSFRGYAVTAHLSERTRVDMCKALAESIFGTRPLFEELSSHLDFIMRDIYPKRNKILHGTWGYGGDQTSSLLPVKARGAVKFGPREYFEAEDILKVAHEIEDAHDKLGQIERQITELLPTMTNWP